MTALQELREILFCEEEISDQERSIRLVDLMNAIGFSKSQREIHIHDIYLQNVIANIIQTTDRCMLSMTGSTSEGMCGNQDHHDSDFLLTARHFKLYTPPYGLNAFKISQSLFFSPEVKIICVKCICDVFFSILCAIIS
jgi:hypothetical protein